MPVIEQDNYTYNVSVDVKIPKKNKPILKFNNSLIMKPVK